MGIAFIDTEIYIHQLLNIKSFILAADVYKSVSVLRFQEEFRTLCIIARDYQPLQVLRTKTWVIMEILSSILFETGYGRGVLYR